MFNLFKKKDGSVKVADKIWMTQEAKWNGILDIWRKDPNIVIIAWFESTLRHLETLFAKETTSTVSLYLAREVHITHLANRKIIFAEHHPMRKKEQESFAQWQLNEAIVHSGLDEPLFKLFGSDKIIGMMKSMGMKETEMIEHKMISSSIENAQEKIEKKIVTEMSATSQEEWVKRNLS